jgi:hypothetical protein
MTDTLAARFADGSILSWVILLIVLEAGLLWWLWRCGRNALAPREWLGNLVSGAMLMLAVRAALLDQSWQMVAGWLLLALLAHVADLWSRWRRVDYAP